MVVYNIYLGESLGLYGVKKEKTLNSLHKVKDFLHSVSGCSSNDIDDWNGEQNYWFGDYFVEVK